MWILKYNEVSVPTPINHRIEQEQKKRAGHCFDLTHKKYETQTDAGVGALQTNLIANA
jgi:hypothetical protein